MELASPLPPQPPWLMDTRGHLLKWQDSQPCEGGVASHLPPPPAPAMASQPPELWVGSVSQPEAPATDTYQCKAKLCCLQVASGRRHWSLRQLWKPCTTVRAPLVSVGEHGPVLPSPKVIAASAVSIP